MQKILTISVAAYNVEQYIKKCLDSLINNEVASDLEVIVVNDGSKDNTLKIVQEYEKKYPDIIVCVDKENGGHGSTINASIRRATGKYFKTVDADDWVSKEGIEQLVSFLKNIDADLVLNPYYETYMSDAEDKLVTPFQSLELRRIYDINDVCSKITVPMHGVTMNTQIIKKVGPVIDENCFYVDTEYAFFPIKFINNVCCMDEPVYYYLLGNPGQSMSINNLISRRAQREKVIKRILTDYNESFDLLGKQKATFISKNMKQMIFTHYKYFMYLDAKTSKAEVKSFDEWLRKNSNDDIYNGLTESNIMKMIRFHRKTSFVFYKAMIGCLHLFHKAQV